MHRPTLILTAILVWLAAVAGTHPVGAEPAAPRIQPKILAVTPGFDPAKPPVLFIPGHSSNPHDWDLLIAHLREAGLEKRFQFWTFLWDSQDRLALGGDALLRCLRSYRQTHPFTRLTIVCHSLGGLATAWLLQNPAAADLVPAIDKVVFIGTPFKGIPVPVVPRFLAVLNRIRPCSVKDKSIIDVGTRSGFIKTLARGALPTSVRYYTVSGNKPCAGIKGLISFFVKGEDDGGIQVTSSRREEALDSVIHVDHSALVRAPHLLRLLRRCLEDDSPNPQDSLLIREVVGLVNQGKHQEALTVMRTALPTFPREGLLPELQFRYGRELLRLDGTPEERRDRFQQAAGVMVDLAKRFPRHFRVDLALHLLVLAGMDQDGVDDLKIARESVRYLAKDHPESAYLPEDLERLRAIDRALAERGLDPKTLPRIQRGN